MPVGQSVEDNGWVTITPDLLRALANECNRYTLRYLDESTAEYVEFQNLSEWVGMQVSEPSSVPVKLRHRTLPIFADLDLIEYNSDENIIRQHPELQLPIELKKVLRKIDEE